MKVLLDIILSSRRFIIEYDIARDENDTAISIVRDENLSYSQTSEYLFSVKTIIKAHTMNETAMVVFALVMFFEYSVAGTLISINIKASTHESVHASHCIVLMSVRSVKNSIVL